jgi:N12 class adenine-specific DNA methylase
MNKNLIVSPPHLVYKWRREILNTIPDAKVVTLNGSFAFGFTSFSATSTT